MGYLYDAMNRTGGSGPEEAPAESAGPPLDPGTGETSGRAGGASVDAAPPAAVAPPQPPALTELQKATAQDALAQLDQAQRQVDELNDLVRSATGDEDESDLPILELADAQPQTPEPAAPQASRAEPHAPAAAAPCRPGTTGQTCDTPRQARAEASALAHSESAESAGHLPFNATPEGFDAQGEVQLDDRMVAAIDPLSIMAEEYRSIRTGILARWQQKRHLVHLITSATPQEGKTVTSLNLAMSFAELRTRRTIVVEADLRLPQFAYLLGLPEAPGIIDVLEDKAKLEDAIVRLPGLGLYVLPAGGRAASHAVQLLSNKAMARTIARLRQEFDHIIIDTPPVLQLADAGILGALSDDVLMVVRLGRTPAPMVEQAIRALSSYSAPVAGLIGTDHHHLRNRRRYSYRYEYTQGRKRRGYSGDRS